MCASLFVLCVRWCVCGVHVFSSCPVGGGCFVTFGVFFLIFRCHCPCVVVHFCVVVVRCVLFVSWSCKC